MSVRYHCPHENDPTPPLDPSYASSSSSFSSLDALYFCEECDAIRCNTCVAVEVASYFCPSCLFDVPSANVRADKNRCARHCFLCPECNTFTEVQGTSTAADGPMGGAAPFVLVCKGCKWTSRQVGLEFEKNTSVALQLQKAQAATDAAQAAYDALKEHIDGYMTTAAPAATPAKPCPTRHISHLTQMAAKSLHRSALTRSTGMGAAGRREDKAPLPWDEMGQYEAKQTWSQVGLERGMDDVVAMRRGVAEVGLESTWESSWYKERSKIAMTPQRVPLVTKLTKRCPHANCRHLLIQPDPKSVRFKIKMAAANYIPLMEVGRRRRRMDVGSFVGPEDVVEQQRRERRRIKRDEVDEAMDVPLQADAVYTFQIAFTNTTLDTVQIRLNPLNKTLSHVPTPHFVVAPPQDAWAYEDDADDLNALEDATEGTSEDGGSVMTRNTSAVGTLSKRSRMSVLAGGSGAGSGSMRERDRKRGMEKDVEKKGNVSKVLVEVEVPPGTRGSVEADFEVRLTYRVEQEGKEEYKTFTFWTRVCFGWVTELQD